MNETIKNIETPREPTNPENVGNCCHILLADDDLEMRRMLAWSLRDKGFKVTECSDGDCLLKHLGIFGPLGAAAAFDLIISDIRMPGMTGMQVLESVREYRDMPPMILITAFGDEDTHTVAKKLGVAAMLDKPFNIDDLLARVDQILPPDLRLTVQPRLSSRENITKAEFPVDVTFRHGCESGPARDLVRELAAKLNRFDALVQRCHVVIDQSNPEERRKHRYLVTISVSCPGNTLVARYNSDEENGHENLYVAIQIVFGKLYRQVKNYHKKLNRNKLLSP